LFLEKKASILHSLPCAMSHEDDTGITGWPQLLLWLSTEPSWEIYITINSSPSTTSYSFM